MVGAIFFLKHSIEQGWLQPPVRVLIGAAAGIALIVLCELKAARKYPVTANALDAAGIATLFATFFAAHSLWGLIPGIAAFGLLAIVTALAVLLSIRRDSMFIAVLGLLGGFATPALLSTGENRPIPLFAYLLLLNVGLSWVAYHKRWAPLSVLSLVLTTVYQWGWVFKFLAETEPSLAMGIFLVFPVVGFAGLLIARPQPDEHPSGAWFERTATTAAVLPLLFAAYFATVPAYGARAELLFGFLLLLDAGLLAIAIARRQPRLHTIGALATLLVLAVWTAVSYSSEARYLAIVFTSVFVTFFLFAPAIAARFGRALDDAAELAAPGLLFVFAALAGIEPAFASPLPLFATLLALLLLCGWRAIALSNAAVWFIAAGFAIVAQAVWSSVHLRVENLAGALSLFVVFGVAMLGVPAIARLRREELAGFVNALYLGLAPYVFLFVVAVNRGLSLPPWPLFAALAVVTLAVSGVSLIVREPSLHRCGVVAAATIMVFWTSLSGGAPWPLVGIVASAVVSAFALVWQIPSRRLGTPAAPDAAAAALVLAEIGAIAAVTTIGAPSFGLLLGVHLINLATLLALTAAYRWRGVPLGAAALAWLAVFQWQVTRDLAIEWRSLLLLAGALYVLFAVYPLILARRAATERDPWVAALIAGAMAFFAGRAALIAGGYEGIVGVIPVTLAAVTAVLLRTLLRLEPPGHRDLGRLALVAGVALAFVTVAIPVQLQHQWRTMGWALEGAALAWLYTRVPHRGLLLASVALLATVFVRLALNPDVFRYEPRGELRIFNWYLYAYLLAAASMFAASWWLSKTEDRVASGLPRASRLLPAAAVILLFLLLNIEIADYYATGPEIVFRFGTTLSQDLTYTIGWLGFGMILLAAGIYLRTRAARIAAVALIAITTLKCFLYDLASLDGLYRVASFVGLAMSLALVSIALQKYVLARPSTVQPDPTPKEVA